MLNYKAYAAVADYSRATAIISREVYKANFSDDFKNRIIEDTKKNVGGITRVKKEEKA